MSEPSIPFLIEPTPDLAEPFLEMAKEFRAAGDDRYDSALDDLAAYFSRVQLYSKGEALPPDKVPQDEFWLFNGSRVIGRSGLRRVLTPSLENEGGHIGYDIRPAERCKGYGTLILKLTMAKARDKGFERVLVTCDDDNIGSAKIIEKNGGVLSGKGLSEKTGKQVRRYWIELRET